MCREQKYISFTSLITVFSFLLCSRDPGWGRASRILEVLSCGAHITLWPCTFECRQPLRWRSNPVSPMSASPATTSRGTRRSVTQCVQQHVQFWVKWILQRSLQCLVLWTCLCVYMDSSCLFLQVYKVIVNVGQQEWFVFRRYAEFDKLYNTVSGGTLSFWFYSMCIT